MKSVFATKKSSVLIYLILCFCLLSIPNLMSVKAETYGEVQVTYTKEESLEKIVTVQSRGPGEIKYGTLSIRNDQRKIVILDDNIIQLELKADKGSEVKSVILNGEDITSTVTNNTITIKGNYDDQTLSVIFDSNILPDTGEKNNINMYIFFTSLPFVFLILLLAKDKKEKKGGK